MQRKYWRCHQKILKSVTHRRALSRRIVLSRVHVTNAAIERAELAIKAVINDLKTIHNIEISNIELATSLEGQILLKLTKRD